MNPLYFRVAEKPDPDVFVPGWVEILDGRFVLDRSVWRSSGVSRSADGCVVLRADHEFGTWELKNLAVGRVVVLSDATRRFELSTDMSVVLRPGTWTGTLTDEFSFVVTTTPPEGPVRRQDGDDPADDRADDDEDDLHDVTTPHALVPRARHYLGTHWRKRLALAYLWRQHLAHTPELAEDLPSATVARAFGVPDRRITRWREDLATYVFDERGHQHAIRDWVIKHHLMTRADVVDADRHVEQLRRNRPWRSGADAIPPR